MRYLIFSDIHSNLEAFEKLLSLDVIESIDKFLFLGDLVGYGADPNDTITKFRNMEHTHAIRGNHDKVISNLESSSLFNPVAAFSAEWSKVKLSEENREFLKNMKKGPLVIDHFLTICHGATFDEDYYVFSVFEAVESMKFMKTSIGFFGHTHFPVIYFQRNNKLNAIPLNSQKKIKLDPNTRYLINPGSIGQPRDKNPKSSFIVYDSDKREILFSRYEYNIKRTQKKIRAAGLPELLASRLESGV